MLGHWRSHCYANSYKKAIRCYEEPLRGDYERCVKEASSPHTFHHWIYNCLMLSLVSGDIMPKTPRWRKTGQVRSSQSPSSTPYGERSNAFLSASDGGSQCFGFHSRPKFTSLKFLCVDAATQTTPPAGERNRTATFVTSTDCTTLRLTPKQASNGIGSRSRLSPISRRRKVPHEADSPLSSKTYPIGSSLGWMQNLDRQWVATVQPYELFGPKASSARFEYYG